VGAPASAIDSRTRNVLNQSRFQPDEHFTQQMSQCVVKLNAGLNNNNGHFMKIESSSRRVFGTLVAMLGVIGSLSLPANAQDQPVPPSDNAASALPPGVYPSSPLAQVVKLMQAGVSEGVITTYVNNSGSTFNLDPDKIIYLKDIGTSDGLVTAMMQRDQELKAQMAASAYQPPPQPAPATTPVQTEPPVEQPADITVNYFYDTLAPYGVWVDVEGYGRCWRPTVMVSDAGWQPYGDHGHWVYTDAGWYWMSDYSWGWAPFHYGRWFHHERFGWCWAPDTVWGPSWVTWRYSGDYCGWAPLPPFTAFVSGIGFTYRGAAVAVDFDFGLGASAFIFVPTLNFNDPHPWRYRAGTRNVTPIFSRATIINNFNVDSRSRTFVNHGIDPEKITAVTRTEIHPLAIREATGPVARGEQLERDGRTLTVNRPNFAANPRPSSQGTVPRATPPSPAMGSPYPPASTSSSPGRNAIAPTAERPSPPVNRYAPVTPTQPSSPNYNSTDDRRYPTPKMQQIEQPKPRVNPGIPAGSAGEPMTPQVPASPPGANRFSPLAQPAQRNYGTPVTTPAPPANPPEASRFTPPVEQPAPTQPPPVNYTSPRNQTPPSESRPNYSQPPVTGNQAGGTPAPSSQSPQSQRSGGNRNQNGQQ
jgi:hypothetical protein